MPEFWRSSGYHLVEVDPDGRLRPTDDFLRAYLLRPELAPVEESCAAENELHQALMENPRLDVPDAWLERLADPDAREKLCRVATLSHPTAGSSDAGSRLPGSDPRGCGWGPAVVPGAAGPRDRTTPPLRLRRSDPAARGRTAVSRTEGHDSRRCHPARRRRDRRDACFGPKLRLARPPPGRERDAGAEASSSTCSTRRTARSTGSGATASIPSSTSASPDPGWTASAACWRPGIEHFSRCWGRAAAGAADP